AQLRRREGRRALNIAVVLEFHKVGAARFVGFDVGQSGVADAAFSRVDFFDQRAAAFGAGVDDRAEGTRNAPGFTVFRPDGVRGFTVGADGLEFLPGLFTFGAGEFARVDQRQVVLELVARTGTVEADHAGDVGTRAAGADRVFGPELAPALERAAPDFLELFV